MPRLLLSLWTAWTVLGLLIVNFAQGDDATQARSSDSLDPALVKFFEGEVRPLLHDKCFKCHGTEKQSGQLRLDSRAAILSGGESGAGIDVEMPHKSLLLEAINYQSLEMPPDGKLSDEQIAVLTKWVELGAPWPGDDGSATPVHSGPRTLTDEDRAFWSFQPLQHHSLPAVRQEAWCHNEIDRFVLANLEQAEIAPSEPAATETLALRLYIDLTGLPPTPDQLDAFLADRSEQAYENLVDELLNSPQYGVEQARRWLDLVRYADSDGYKQDAYRPAAWRYRDYVIQSFNADKPYDRFVMEQLAGDEIAPSDPQALVATGYLRLGIYEYNQRDALTQWRDMLNDITDTTADVFLGLGLGCARCHDHKFDPILQKDYYRLQSFFANISIQDAELPHSDAHHAQRVAQLAAWEAATAELRAALAEIEDPIRKRLRDDAVSRFSPEIQAIILMPDEQKTSYERQITHLANLQIIDAQKGLEAKVKKDDKERYADLKKQLAEHDSLKPADVELGHVARDDGPSAPDLLIPGKERLGPVEPGYLTLFDPDPAVIVPLPEAPNSSGRRAALAHWLTQPDHPLTSRVMVNRIWQQHFGKGLVATASDFGHLGEAPSHPQLLDWLAIRFVQSGWSIKDMHRLMVTSSTYRQTALRSDSRAELVDPHNHLLWRSNIRRLEAEQVRDAMLAVAGELNNSVTGGPGENAEKTNRRSAYTRVYRNDRLPVLAAFDFPDRITSSSQRNVTVSPNQSLLLINSEWALQRATHFAERVQREIDGPLDSQIRHAVRLALARNAQPAELELLAGNTGDTGSNGLNLVDICHILLNSNEFLYID